MLGSLRPGCQQLLGLAGGQQLLQAEMGGGSVSLLFDLTQLALRPAIMWGDEPPDAVTSVPPLLPLTSRRQRIRSKLRFFGV